MAGGEEKRGPEAAAGALAAPGGGPPESPFLGRRERFRVRRTFAFCMIFLPTSKTEKVNKCDDSCLLYSVF